MVPIHPSAVQRTRRNLLKIIAAAPFASLALPGEAGETWPQRPIKVIIPQGTGGGVDIVSRLIGPAMGDALGQPIVIENKPGGSANIGAEFVARALPDGYTVLYGFNQIPTMNPHIYPRMTFNPLVDLVPVTQTATVGYILTVNNDLPVKSLSELIDYAKKNPGKLSYGSLGAGSAHHLMTEMISQSAGIQMTHIPYKQSPVSDLIAGNIQVLIDVTPALQQYVKAGAVRALAYTGPARLAAFPNLPTLTETYPGLDMVGWQGFWVPKGTPQPIVDRLGQEARKVVQSPEIRKKLADLNLDATGTSASEMTDIINRESKRWGGVIKDRNIKIDA